MPNPRRGYLPPGTIIVLAGICLFVAIAIFFNAQLLRNINKQREQNHAGTPAAQLNSDPTSSWKTYTNSTYGYSIKFPQVFFKSYENPTSILFDGRIGTYKEGSGVLNGISLDLTVSRYSDIKTAINANLQDITSTKKVTIGLEIPATQVDIKTSNLQEDLYTYVQLPEQKVLQIKISWTEKNSAEYFKLANQILSTLKFTN